MLPVRTTLFITFFQGVPSCSSPALRSCRPFLRLLAPSTITPPILFMSSAEGITFSSPIVNCRYLSPGPCLPTLSGPSLFLPFSRTFCLPLSWGATFFTSRQRLSFSCVTLFTCLRWDRRNLIPYHEASSFTSPKLYTWNRKTADFAKPFLTCYRTQSIHICTPNQSLKPISCSLPLPLSWPTD